MLAADGSRNRSWQRDRDRFQQKDMTGYWTGSDRWRELACRVSVERCLESSPLCNTIRETSDRSQTYTAAWQWGQTHSQSDKELLSLTRRTMSLSIGGMARTEPWSQHHTVCLGLHDETEATEMPKSTEVLGQFLQDAGGTWSTCQVPKKAVCNCCCFKGKSWSHKTSFKCFCSRNFVWS